MDVKITFDEVKIKDAEESFVVKVLMLKGEKGDPGMPTDEQVAEAVDAWLTAHPEATTTVQDGAITDAKMNQSIKITNAQIDALFA